MDMKKILQALDGAAAKPVVDSNDMKKFVSIIREGKGPLNRPTVAETLTMQHYTEQKKTITTPVLNVAEGATPSMIGKYFKAVEQELREAAEQPNIRATSLAKRVANKINEGGITLPNPDGSLPPGAFTAADQEKLNQRVGAQAAAAQPPKGVNLAPDYLQKAASGAPGRWMISADDAKVALDWLTKNPNYKPPSAEPAAAAPAGYSVDYLKKAADPNRTGRYMISIEKAQELLQQQGSGINEAEGEPEGVAHLTKELLTHIVQQSGKEGAHAVVKSLQWGDGAAKELLHLIINDLKDDIAGMNEGLRDPKDNPCWTGYKPVGTKKKAGKTVPNCVPKEAVNPAQQAAIAIAKKKAGKK